MNKIKLNSKIVIIGKRGTGKTTLLDDILHYNSYYHVCVVMGGEDVERYLSYIPNCNVYKEYNEQAIKALIKRQKHMIWGKNHAILVLDDVIDDKKLYKTPIMRSIYKNGRCLYVSSINSIQDCMDMPPGLRACVDYIFMFRETNHRNRRELYCSYAGIFPSYEMFETIFEESTKKFGCLVINNRCISNKIEDVVFWYNKTELDPSSLKQIAADRVKDMCKDSKEMLAACLAKIPQDLYINIL